MPKIIRREVRTRGAFGQIIKWIFILFNLLMVFLLFKTCSAVGQQLVVNTNGNINADAYNAGTAIGGTIATTMIMMFWALGTVILGALTYFTRGSPVIIEEEVPD